MPYMVKIPGREPPMKSPIRLATVAFAVVAFVVTPRAQQSPIEPTNNAPNPYKTVEGWAKMPEGRTWGSTAGVGIDKDGKSIWVSERCGANGCWDRTANKMSPLDPILHFSADGTFLKSFGQGLFVNPHGLYVDRDGNIWVTDWQDNLPRRGRGAAADAPLPPPPDKIVGHQVYKFSPDGKVLLVLGKAGGNQPGQPEDPASFYEPNNVITNAAGDIFVCEGHSANAQTSSGRIAKFDKNGKFIKEWGKFGSAPGEFNNPHSLAFDSKGRLFIADRGNNRIQIYDQDGNRLETGLEQFSRISGLWIDKNDMLYAADSESGGVARDRTNWTRGIRIGSVKDGKVLYLIPDSAQNATGTSSAEGIAVDRDGIIYGAEVGQKALKRYEKK